MHDRNHALLVASFVLALAGCEGPAGPSGASGPAGPSGATGPAGEDGVDGRDGTDGMDGIPGRDGTEGEDGIDGESFDFRDDPPSAYTRFDRMGMPAVATAVIVDKNRYNDADPADDVTLDAVSGLPRFVASDVAPSLAALHDALRDDFVALGLTPCATRVDGVTNVLPCATQAVVPGGPAVLDLVVPDTLRIDPTAPAGFPNGRRLQDPVIDVTLAALLLDLGRHPPTTLAGLPLNPPTNDLPFLARFPYLAFPHRP
jgi:hypothetical protein